MVGRMGTADRSQILGRAIAAVRLLVHCTVAPTTVRDTLQLRHQGKTPKHAVSAGLLPAENAFRKTPDPTFHLIPMANTQIPTPATPGRLYPILRGFDSAKYKRSHRM